MNAKEYRESNTVAIENCLKYHEWLFERDKNGNLIRLEKYNIILGDNRERMEVAFGKPHFHFVSEFRHHCWKFESPIYHATFVILTAKTKGTSIEMMDICCDCIQHRSDDIIEFVKSMAELISVRCDDKTLDGNRVIDLVRRNKR